VGVSRQDAKAQRRFATKGTKSRWPGWRGRTRRSRGRPLAEVCRELGQQTLVDNVRDPKLAERMRKLEAWYRLFDDGEPEDGTDGLGASMVSPPDAARRGTGVAPDGE